MVQEDRGSWAKAIAFMGTLFLIFFLSILVIITWVSFWSIKCLGLFLSLSLWEVGAFRRGKLVWIAEMLGKQWEGITVQILLDHTRFWIHPVQNIGFWHLASLPQRVGVYLGVWDDDDDDGPSRPLSIFSFRDGAVQFVRSLARSLWHYKRRLGVGPRERRLKESERVKI